MTVMSWKYFLEISHHIFGGLQARQGRLDLPPSSFGDLLVGLLTTAHKDLQTASESFFIFFFFIFVALSVWLCQERMDRARNTGRKRIHW